MIERLNEETLQAVKTLLQVLIGTRTELRFNGYLDGTIVKIAPRTKQGHSLIQIEVYRYDKIPLRYNMVYTVPEFMDLTIDQINEFAHIARC
jgi:hypothetical protein